ncbi:winged helix-turn-helix transcriptional regulator [Actinoplanes sp. G11-F43]|uniref:winged helix-turn-helix transcriptional regulator n=1 Tax=Actinoplanes sp. G11-F43 TaxID=3424130 RepID=UPI003D33C97F
MDLDTIYDTLKLLGYRWTLEILASLAESPKRFNELQRHCGNFNPKTHAAAVDRLLRYGLIRHDDSGESRYALTAKGAQALPALRKFVADMKRWDEVIDEGDRSRRS